jgi:hypothetical protein
VPAAIALLAAAVLAGAGAGVAPAAIVPSCAPASLSATFGGQGTTQSLLGAVTITNHGGGACRLSGRPSIAMRGGSPHELLRERAMNTTALFPGQRFSAATVLAPGRSASVVFQWFNWCNPAAKTPSPSSGGRRPSQVLVTLARGARAIVATVAQPRTVYLPVCGDPREPSEIFVSLWTAGG